MDRLAEIANLELISNLERERLKQLDKELGTETYFHETEKYEDRLDS
jgi:hypothetical protein